MSDSFISPAIFESLQTRIDEDAEVKEQIRNILHTLERQERRAQSTLSRAHNTPTGECELTSSTLLAPKRNKRARG